MPASPYDRGWGDSFEDAYAGAQDRDFRNRQLALQAEIERGTLSLRRAAEERAQREQQLVDEQRQYQRQAPEFNALKKLQEEYPTPDAQDPMARVNAYSRAAVEGMPGPPSQARDPYTREPLRLGERQTVPQQGPLEASGEPLPPVETTVYRPPATPEEVRSLLDQRRAGASREALEAFRQRQNELQQFKILQHQPRVLPPHYKDLEDTNNKLQAQVGALDLARRGQTLGPDGQPRFILELMQPGKARDAFLQQADEQEFRISQQMRGLELSFQARGKAHGEKMTQTLMPDITYSKLRERELAVQGPRIFPGWNAMTPQQKIQAISKQVDHELELRTRGIFTNPYTLQPTE